MRILIIAAALAALTASSADAADTSTAPPPTDLQGGGTLSDKLSTTGGVIHPSTDVDPAIKVAPPNAGTTMPVIPPPGTPGGDPNVTPK